MKPAKQCRKGHDLTLEGAIFVSHAADGTPYNRCRKCRERSARRHREKTSQSHQLRKKVQLEELRKRLGLGMPAHRWWERAMCLGDDTELYFADWGEDEAKEVCKLCPVRLDCLSDNLQQDFGVYGGMTRDERAVLIDPAKKKPNRLYKPHPGTVRAIVDRYLFGWSISSIARDTKLSRDKVRGILRSHDAIVRRRERELLIRELLDQGLTCKQVAEDMGCKEQLVRNIQGRRSEERRRDAQQGPGGPP